MPVVGADGGADIIVPKQDDGLHDAVALVEAVGCGDLWVNLAKLLAELVNDNSGGHAVCVECFRFWAGEAITRL